MKPIPANLEMGTEKITGYIMKLTQQGLLFELEKINFRAGSILSLTFELPGDSVPILESVRSIKHYDRFYRKAPPKNKKPEELAPEEHPKKLIEAHFVKLSEPNRLRIHKYLTQLHLEEMKRPKSK